MHRRQYLPDDRTTHYDVLRWRSHAEKFARLQNAALSQAIRYVIGSKREWTSHQKSREAITTLIAAWPFYRRWNLWIRIAIARFVLRFSRKQKGGPIGQQMTPQAA
jgi:hypothetical protein